MSFSAIALLSGGLDSSLAVRLILDQGIEVEALNFVTPFCTCNRNGRCEAQLVADELGIENRTIPIVDAFFEVIKRPKHGHGRGMNPCLDCRILMFSAARDRLEASGAEFVFTGEVLGQRPMSQHRQAMEIIDRESGLEDRVLRPLSARLLPPTLPERLGIVCRDRLLDIQGRSRKEQMALAADYGMADYPCPAGGCRLTEQGYARRMRDLVEHVPHFGLNDVNLLRAGRHFRLSPQAMAMVGRGEEENRRLETLAKPGDLLFEARDWSSPIGLLRGIAGDDGIYRTAAITARYSDASTQDVVVNWGEPGSSRPKTLSVHPMKADELDALRV